MNKKQMREAVQAAIQFSDECDVAHQASRYYSRENRQWARLNAFLISFGNAIGESDPELYKQLDDFRERVMKGENPLQIAAPDVEEKSK